MPEMFEFSKPFQTTYCPDHGTVDEVQCSLCGTMATVHRNVYGCTSMSESMAKRGHYHDVFRCPVNDAEPEVFLWGTPPEGALHAKIAQLKKEIDKTASTSIKNIIQQEIDDIVKNLSIS